MQCNEFLHESLDFKDITWKIRNVFSLPESVGYFVQSPPFSFAEATWELRMYPYGEIEESQGRIELSICRLKYRIPLQNLSYKLCFQTRRKKEVESYSSTALFTPDRNEWVNYGFLKISELIQKKNAFAPNGVLTILCQMKIKKIAGIHRYSQTESTVLQLESSSGRSRKKSEPSTSTDKALPGEKLVHDFKELFLKQEDCDFVIKVKEQKFHAHKTILRARSPVFASTLRNDMKEKATGVVEIDDCDPSSFSDFLCFLYCGHVEKLTTENVFSLFTTADKYDVQDLRSECLEFMKNNLSVDTFCETITVALQHLEKELIDLATAFFGNHLQEIIVTVKWQTFVVENPIQSNEIMVKALVNNKK